MVGLRLTFGSGSSCKHSKWHSQDGTESLAELDMSECQRDGRTLGSGAISDSGWSEGRPEQETGAKNATHQNLVIDAI
jgi:hypothetical protein